MSFLAFLLGVLLLQSRGPLGGEPWDTAFAALCRRLAVASGDLWRILLAVLLPVVVCAVVLQLLRPLLFGLPWIALAAVVLWFSCGRRDSAAIAERYCQACEKGDFEGAYLYLRETLPGCPAEQPDSAQTFHRQASAQLLYEAYQRWFPAVFYFLLFGPWAALAYRLIAQAAEAGSGRRLLIIFDWLPARLLAMTFAVTGDFVRSREALIKAMAPERAAASVLQEVAVEAAIGPGQGLQPGPLAAVELREQLALIGRSAAAWLVAAALFELLA